MRYCFGNPFVWQEEVQLALSVWVVFLGGRYAFVCGNHAAIDVIVEMFPEKYKSHKHSDRHYFCHCTGLCRLSGDPVYYADGTLQSCNKYFKNPIQSDLSAAAHRLCIHGRTALYKYLAGT